MKKSIIVIMLGLLLLSSHFNQAQAVWSGFGKKEDNPEVTNLFVGDIEITEAHRDEPLLLDKSNLQGENVVIKGFASKAKAPLAVAKISLDGGQTWEQVNIQQGSFIFSFALEEEREYQPQFKVMDTTGAESDPHDIPSFKLIYKPVEVEELVEETFQEMIRAYSAKDFSGFMKYVSENFRGDVFALEDAIRADFTNYSTVNLDVTIQQVNQARDEVRVYFEFDWYGTKKSDGSTVNPSRGRAEYLFVREGSGWKLASMDTVIFGISEASEVAIVSTTSTVDDTSTTFDTEDTTTTTTTTTTLLTVDTVTIPCGSGVVFSTGLVAAATGDLVYDSFAGNFLECQGSAEINLLATSGSLSDQTSAPSDDDPGWTTSYALAPQDYIFAGREDEGGNYAMFRISTGGGGGADMVIQLKYQDDGTRSLPQ